MSGLHHDLSMICRVKGIRVAVDQSQPWLSRTGHLNPLVQSSAPADVIDALASIHRALRGDERRLANKGAATPSAPDLVHEELGCIIEIDELPHFTTARRRTFGHYPPTTRLGFDLAEYGALVERHHAAADAVLAGETTKDFPFPGGRQAQRAYQDALRDLLAPVFTGYPVIRLAVPEQALTGVVQRLEARLEALRRT